MLTKRVWSRRREYCREQQPWLRKVELLLLFNPLVQWRKPTLARDVDITNGFEGYSASLSNIPSSISFQGTIQYK